MPYIYTEPMALTVYIYKHLHDLQRNSGNLYFLWNRVYNTVPQVVEVACHHSNAKANKPTKRDGRVIPLIFRLHNADKA